MGSIGRFILQNNSSTRNTTLPFKFRGALHWEVGFQRELQYDVLDIAKIDPKCENPLIAADFWWKVELRRNVKPYLEQIFFPTFLIVIVSWTSFLIPWDSFPGRFGLLGGLVLMLINILLNTITMSPHTKGVNALTTWIILCITLILIAIIEYSFLLFIVRYWKIDSVKPRDRKSIRRRRVNIKTLQILEDPDNHLSPLSTRCKKLDTYSLILSPLLLFFVIIVYVLTFYHFNDLNSDTVRKKHKRFEMECTFMKEVVNQVDKRRFELTEVDE